MIDLKALLKIVVEKEASDLHLKVGKPPIIRLKTNLIDLDHRPLKSSEVEELARSMMADGQWEAFQRRGEIDYAYIEEEVGRFRTNVFRQCGLVGIVMRYVKAKIPTFEELHLPPVLKEISLADKGIVIVSGATGCGKSTTLAAMVGFINKMRRRNIVTIEDPIEFLHSDEQSIISQREVGIDTRSFASALKVVLRQDPDIVMVGEMRDRDSFAAGLSAAETGHLVLSTSHSPDAAQVIVRIMEFFSPDERNLARFQLASNLVAIICQRLLRRADADGLVPAVEIMRGSPTVQKLIRENKIHKLRDAIRDGRDEGMQTFNQHLVKLVQNSFVTEEEALANSSNPEALKMNLQGIFLDESRQILGTE